MNVLRRRKYLFALLALLVVFAACKGESPTAPNPNTGGGPTGPTGGTPPTGATIALSVSNPNPLVNSTSVITATVTQGGNPVPNGTAVEFHATDPGTFTDTSAATTIRTTTNGVATATLTSSTSGAVTVTAIVNNVTAETTVTFSATTTQPPVTPSAPTIKSISPTSGKPAGGDIVTLTGTNFRTPIRVLFTLPDGTVKEAFVASVTSTQVQVVTPAVNLGAGQTLDAKVTLINEAGTPNEVAVNAPSAFTFRLAQLTPAITTVSPDSGPITGGTRITILGSSFEAPVQVSFAPVGGAAWSQMQVVSVLFNQIIAVTPAARDVNPTGSGPLTGPVDLRVVNINSAKSVVLSNAFRYTPALQITGVRPLIGSALGGTDVTIDGIGFDPPVDVFIGGVLAQTLRVSGTQLLVRTSPLPTPCGGGGGAISVTNINDGSSVTATQIFTFIGVNPVITGFTPLTNVTPGSTLAIDVLNPGVGPLGSAILRFTINGQTLVPSPSVITVGTGTQTFSVVVPTNFTFPTVACTTASATPGTQLGTVTTSITFTNTTNGCTASLENALTITPPGPNTCLAPPTATSSAPPCPAGVVVSSAAAAGTATGTGTFTISNASSARDLTLGAPSVTVGSTNPPTSVTVTPNTSQTVTAGNSVVYTITVDPSAVGPYTGTITIPTNDPSKPALQICFSGSGT